MSMRPGGQLFVAVVVSLCVTFAMRKRPAKNAPG